MKELPGGKQSLFMKGLQGLSKPCGVEVAGIAIKAHRALTKAGSIKSDVIIKNQN